jgi:glycosyltransferase involved in cell wall biosynthesis
MKILYISSVCTPKVLEYIFNTSKVKPGLAIQKFHRLLIEGFSKNHSICKIEVLSSLPISPSGHKKKFWKLNKDSWSNVTFNYLWVINLPFFKNSLVFILTFFKVLFWCHNNDKNDKIVICDILNVSVFWSSFLACKISSKPIAVIITDLPIHMVTNSSETLFIKKIYIQICSFFIKHSDYHIGLTEQMNAEVNPLKKPFLVMEGLVDEGILNENIKKTEKEKIILLYAGGLYEKYGLKNLIEAFNKLEGENLELHLYGSGDMEKDINNYCKLNNRIFYFGVVPNSVVVNELHKATLLINPRPVNEEFTKFSFPSKNMEYMASGTPLLTTVLPGMPTEYYDYVFLLEDETIEGFISTINKIVLKPKDELYYFGNRAKEFVLSNKSNVIQANRIINFLNRSR